MLARRGRGGSSSVDKIISYRINVVWSVLVLRVALSGVWLDQLHPVNKIFFVSKNKCKIIPSYYLLPSIISL